MSEQRWLTLPNVISVARIGLAGVFLFVQSAMPRMLILAVGAASDWLDGWIARRWRQGTRVGEILDPAADRVLVLAVLAAFWVEARIQAWELLLFLVRDLFTSAAFVVALLRRSRLRFRARKPGKRVTLLQLVALLVLFVQPEWSAWLASAVALASVWAITDYARNALRKGQAS
ncbi:MAG: CDP-alcohol phosphatidyltransferase family protein [Longimicrobiales bacterium]